MRVGKYIPLYVFIKQIKAYGRYFKAKQCLKIMPNFGFGNERWDFTNSFMITN
jgi:hypothetical protein